MAIVDNIKLKRLLQVEPFRRITPFGNFEVPHEPPFIGQDAPLSIGIPNPPVWQWYTQADFLRELYPTGHKIFDESYYPDQYVQIEVSEYDSEGVETRKKKWVQKKVTRVALPLQQVIKVQQNIHLCGNNLFLHDANIKPSDASKSLLAEYKQFWLDDNMEQAMHQCVNSEKCTGNTAIAFYFIKENNKVKLGHKVYSYLDGYTICNPVIDYMTGRVKAQAICYTQYDNNGFELTDYVDVWDNVYFYRFKKDKQGIKGRMTQIAEFFGLDGYSLEGNPIPHGFPEPPIKVKRNRDGACWSHSQSLIETYEMGVSQMAQNCNVLSTAIMFLKGGDAQIQGMADGRPFAIVSNDPSSDAKFITPNDPSVASETSLKIIKENIFLSSFTVTPPEMRSGDLPGIAIKLIYSPSLEKAMDDAADWDEFIDGVVRLHKYGAGVCMGKSSDLEALQVSGNIIPYVHENTAEIINNINTSLNSGSLSKETAALRHPYSANDEYRIIEAEAAKQREIDEKEAMAMLEYKNANKTTNIEE